MSDQTRQLMEFGERLAKEGYPTALIEWAVERMNAMETVILEQKNELITSLRSENKARKAAYIALAHVRNHRWESAIAELEALENEDEEA